MCCCLTDRPFSESLVAPRIPCDNQPSIKHVDTNDHPFCAHGVNGAPWSSGCCPGRPTPRPTAKRFFVSFALGAPKARALPSATNPSTASRPSPNSRKSSTKRCRRITPPSASGKMPRSRPIYLRRLLFTPGPGTQPPAEDRSGAPDQPPDPRIRRGLNWSFQPPETAVHRGRLRAEYFRSDGMNKKANKVLSATDTRGDFDFGEGSPGAGLAPDQFSIAWARLPASPRTPGSMSCGCAPRTGARLYLNSDLRVGDANQRDDSDADARPRWWICGSAFRRRAARGSHAQLFLLGGRSLPAAARLL